MKVFIPVYISLIFFGLAVSYTIYKKELEIKYSNGNICGLSYSLYKLGRGLQPADMKELEDAIIGYCLESNDLRRELLKKHEQLNGN